MIIKTSKAMEKGFKKAVVAFYSVNEAEEHFRYPYLSRPERSGNANGHSLWKDTNSDKSRVRVYSESPFSRELLALKAFTVEMVKIGPF